MAQVQKIDKKDQPVKAPRITQKMMVDFATLLANYELICERYDEEKERWIHMLKHPKCEQEEGALEAVLDEIEQRRPHWRDEYVKIAGKPAAEEIVKSTPVTYRRKVRIERKATINI